MSAPDETGRQTPDAGEGPVLLAYPENLAVVRLGPGAEVPAWAESSSVFSVTATALETTVVCAGRSVPAKAPHRKPYAAFRADGVLADLATVVEVLAVLAEEGVDAHPVASFDALWVLVPAADADRAVQAWRRAGLEVAPAPLEDASAPQDRGSRSDRPRTRKKS